MENQNKYSHLISESNFPHEKRLWISEFVKLQFRHLLSLLSDHVVLQLFHRHCRTRSQRFCRKYGHWNCALIFKLSSSFRLQGLLLGFFARRQIEFFEDDLWVNQTWKIDYQKRFPAIPDVFHVSSEQGTRTRNHRRLTGNVRQPSTTIRFHILKILQNHSWN